MHHLRTKGRIVSLVVVAALVAGGCGGSTDDSSKTSATQSTTSQSTPAAGLPKTLTIGAQISFPPFEFYGSDGTTLKGYEPDLFNALFNRLGIEPKWVNAPFATLFSGLQSGRFDILINGILDRKDREKSFDFVTYIKDVSGVMTTKGNPKGLQAPADLCGTTIAAVRGTTQETWVKDQAPKCPAGKKLTLLSVESDTQAKLQMRTGRAAGVSAQFATIGYAMTQAPDDYEATPIRYGETVLGIVLPKDATALRDAIQKEMQAMIDDGSYKKILDQWHLADVAVDTSTVNPYTSSK